MLQIEIVAVPEEWCLGKLIPRFSENLPTKGDVLRVILYHHLVLKKSLSDSFGETALQVISAWCDEEKQPTSKKSIVRKLLKLHAQYKLQKKNKNLQTRTQQTRNEDFELSLTVLFDASLAPPTRPPSKKKKLSEKIVPQAESTVDYESDSVSEKSDQTCDENFENGLSKHYRREFTPPKPSSILETMTNSEEVTSMVTRVGLSSRNFVKLTGSIARAAGEDISRSTFSRSTVQRRQAKAQTVIASHVKENFRVSADLPLVVHWDGKLMDSYSSEHQSTARTDRHAIAVTGLDVEKLLGVPAITSGTGYNQAKVFFHMTK